MPMARMISSLMVSLSGIAPVLSDQDTDGFHSRPDGLVGVMDHRIGKVSLCPFLVGHHHENCPHAVTGGMDRKAEDFCTPCGVCRQVMNEFCDPETFLVISAVSPDKYRVYTLKELLPYGFGPDNLKN